MPKKVRILLVVLVVIALAGGGWFYLQSVKPQQTDTLTLYGNVDIREVQPAFNDSGHVTAMLVQEGAQVRRGELLATLDDTRYAAALAQAKATMAAAKVTYLNDQVNYQRYASLAKTSAASEQLRDNAKAQFDAAVASYEAAVAAVALAQREFDDTRLYAPSDGVIEERILQPGDMASPSTPVYTMALPNPLWVRAYIPERDVGRLRLGQVATVETDSYPGRAYHGWIGYLSPTSEFTPKTVETPELRTSLVYQVRVYVCDSRGELRLGMPATVHIDSNRPAATERPGCGAGNAAR
jgi:membrane fusion protein YbhG